MINRQAKSGFSAHRLTLWKPREEISITPSNTLGQRVRSLGNFSQFAQTLDPFDRVVDVVQSQEPPFHLDVIVQIPVSTQQGSSIFVDAAATGQLRDVPKRDLERFLESCLGVIIHLASDDPNKLFTAEDLMRNGFDLNIRRNHLDFVQTFWEDMVDKLDIHINDDNYRDAPKLLPQECRETLNIHILPPGSERGRVLEPDGQGIIAHLLSAATFEHIFWSSRLPSQLDEADTKYTFFTRFSNSGVLPENAECLLYAMCSLLRYDPTFLLE